MKTFRAGLIALALLPAASASRAEEVEMTVTIDALTDRVFRGVLINDDPVLQPGFTLGWRGWSASVWGSMDMTGFGSEGKKGGVYGDRELDFQEAVGTVAYDHDFGPVALGGGLVHRVFPGQPMDETDEAFVRFRADLPVVISLEIVRDLGRVEGWYGSLNLGHAFRVGAATHLEVDGRVGCGNDDYNEVWFDVPEDACSDAHVRLGVSHGVSHVITWRGWAEYTEIASGHLADGMGDDDHLVIGSGGTFRF